MRYIIPVLFASLLFLAQTVDGQYYETGQDPASLKWMQVRTGRFNVIFPEKYGQAGIDFAHYLDESHLRLTSLFPEKRYRIPVVIHSYSTISNGYVAWAPKRMEIYPAPEQNAVPGDQFRLLALHELAHVFEMEALNTGFSEILGFFLGEQVTGVVSSLLPLWYLEGNAVVAESALTSSGRGRSAAFQKQMKALTNEKDRFYNYDKIVNGSFRDFVPDQYQTGFQMTAWAMAKYDPGIWNKVLRKTGSEPFTINPVNVTLRNEAGLTKRKLYRETFDTLRKAWKEELSSEREDYEELNPPGNKKFINYYSPVSAGRDSIIAIRTALYTPPALVLVNPVTKAEKVIYRPGYMYPWLLSYGGGKIVWVENRRDPRWQNRDYSIIKAMDLKHGSVKTFSRRTRYLSASVSPDGKVISAVENTADNINNLVLIDAASENIISAVPSPGNVYLQRPQWSYDGKEITVIYLTEDGEGIMSYSPAGKTWKKFVESKEDYQSSFLGNDSLFYVSSVSGTENIFLRTPDKNIKQLTLSRYGATDVSLLGDRMLFSDYTSAGNKISVTDLKKDFSNEPASPGSSFLINRLDEQQPKTRFDIPATTPDYRAVPYRKWQHLFRFHSWMPFYADLERIQSDPESIRPGFTIMSQNSLSTLITTLGYEYSREKEHVFHSKVTWQGQYPVLESRVQYGHTPDVYGTPGPVNPGLRLTNEISLPLSFSSGFFTRFVRPSVLIDHMNNVFAVENRLYDFNQTDLKPRLVISNYSRSAFRDIYPRWAQTFDLNYYTSIFDRDLFGSTVFLKTAFYFPGFLRNNGIRLKFEVEKQSQAKYLFGNRVSFPRGFNRLNAPSGYGNIVSRELAFASLDYVFPVAYPDLSIVSLVYIKRIRSGLFYDIASGTGNRYSNPPGSNPAVTYNNFNEKFRSFGAELLADFHLLRIPFMISGGVQSAWKDPGSAPVINILFNIDLYGFSLGKRRNEIL